MNIKDSYIHGDLAVVRSIKNFEISSNNLVLKYTNADSNSTEKTYSIPISDFNSALSNKFVTTDTNQVITGLKIFNSNTTGFNTSTREITGNPLIIGRYSSNTEALHIGVDDNTAYFIHRQDETISNFAFIGTWDDTESGGGAGAGYKRIDFVMNQTSDPYISINGNKVWHEGNDGAGSGLHADFLDGHHGSYYAAATSLGDYLPLSGGTMTGNLKWKNETALPEQTSPLFFLVIDGFGDGGTTKWSSKANVLKALTALTSSAKGSTSKPIYWTGSAFAETNTIPTSFTITANATDGLWDLTGTNGSNAVTYAVGAYSTQLSKASFDTSSTNPTRNDRLNYNGYFYATKLYSGAKEVITVDNASNLKWANLSVSSSVNYATKPVFDQVSIGGSSSVTAGAATMKYNSTNKSIDFIFN